MGIVNASPDSFSDVGVGHDLAARVQRGVDAVDAGADLLDVGGQSGITGVPEISEEEEIDRVVPVVEGILAARPGTVISVDTYRPAVTEAVLAAGAAIINDVSCLLHEDVARACGAHGAALVVMHTKARPKHRMQDADLYGDDIGTEVAGVLRDRVGRAVALGVDEEGTIVDPGIDYAKTPAQSVALLRDLAPVRALGRPVLYALSRKDFVGALTQRAPQHRAAGTLAAIGHVGWEPGAIFRVHDVAATVDHLTVTGVLAGSVEVDRDLRLEDHLRWADGRAGTAPPPPSAAAGA